MTLCFRAFLLSFLLVATCMHGIFAQSYYSSTTRPIGGNGQVIYDTIEVSGLDSAMLNSSFGLDSVTLNLFHNPVRDLVISLVAPDGTIVNLVEQRGMYGSHYTNTCFDIDAPYLLGESSPPFTGALIPDNNHGIVNNGQNGNGVWQLRILNKGDSTNGYIINWGLHFNTTPALPLMDSSTLPIVVINTNDVMIPHNLWYLEDAGTKIDAQMGIIYNGVGLVNSLADSFHHYSGNIKIRTRGTTSSWAPQVSYAIDTKDSTWNDIDVPLLDMPAEEDWILYAPWCDKTLMRNIIAYQLSNDVGRYAAKTRLCELVINGDYKGVYVLAENIKRGSNRVAINKMDTDDTTGNQLTGGYLLQIDRGYENDTAGFTSNYEPCTGSTSTIKFLYEYPKTVNMQPAQRNYIAGYIDSFEYALANINMNDTLSGFRKYIDVPSFVDFMLLQELGNNVDAYRLSSFLYKPRMGKLHAGPVWDFNLAYGNAYYYSSWNFNTYRWDLPCPFFDQFANPFWWKQLWQDSTYQQELKCRYSVLRQGAFSITHIDAMIDSLKLMLDVPQERHFQRWPILGRFIEPNIFIGDTWEEEVDNVKDWLHQRIAWLDTQLYDEQCWPISTHVEEVNTASVHIYPNPVKGVLQITSPATINKIVIYNLHGQAVYSHTSTAKSIRLETEDADLANGSYIIEVFTASGVHRGKLAVIN